MSLITTVGFLFSLYIRHTAATCQSFGSDFVDGGKYSLEGNLNLVFTANESFSGCTPDTAHNILVDPNGDESDCSDTQMQPDGIVQNFSCSAWTYDRMYSGEWSIIVLSNNGDGEPISYQRDFYLSILDSTAANTNVASSTGAAKREEPTTLATLAYYSSAPEYSTPSAFAAPTPSAYRETPSAFPTDSYPTPSSFVPFKGGETPSGYTVAIASSAAQPTPGVKDRIPSGSAAEYVEALLNGTRPGEDCKREFVEERKSTLSNSS